MKKKSRQLKNGYVMVYKHKGKTAQIPTPIRPHPRLRLVQTLANLKQLLVLLFG